jgi:molybdopterin converting factor small subunit
MTRVMIPSQLVAYTGGATRAEAHGPTVDAVMHDLDRQYPGLRFRVVDEQGRIRKHMRIFVGMEQVQTLDRRVTPGDEVMIFGALSGG